MQLCAADQDGKPCRFGGSTAKASLAATAWGTKSGRFRPTEPCGAIIRYDGSNRSLPETPPPEPVPQERQHRKNEKDNEKYLGSFPGEGCHASEAKEGSD